MKQSSIIWRFILVAVAFGLPACGESGGLSRGKAEKALEEEINKKADFPTVRVLLGKTYFRLPEEYRNDTVCISQMAHGSTPGGFLPYTHPRGKWTNWAAAAEAGFITGTAEVYAYYDLGQPKQALRCQFQLSDKAKKYVVSEDRDGMATLKVIDRVKVEVTGLTKPAEMQGSTLSEAEFTYTYTFNPLGEVLAAPFRDLSGTEKNGEASDKGRAAFRLYDDGWRLVH